MATAIKEYDDLKRELEGEKLRGNPNLPRCGKLEGWTQQQTADDLGISRQAVGRAIQIAEATEKRPIFHFAHYLLGSYNRKTPRPKTG